MSTYSGESLSQTAQYEVADTATVVLPPEAQLAIGGIVEAHELPEPPDITEVVPIDPRNPEDAACLAEIYNVLKRHQNLGRIGLWQIHQHRDIKVGPDQAMVESTYPETQEQVIRPMNIADIDPTSTVQTLFQFGTKEGSDGVAIPVLGCAQRCIEANYPDGTKGAHVAVTHL